MAVSELTFLFSMSAPASIIIRVMSAWFPMAALMSAVRSPSDGFCQDGSPPALRADTTADLSPESAAFHSSRLMSLFTAIEAPQMKMSASICLKLSIVDSAALHLTWVVNKGQGK
ncbi:unnamed protein product [Meganyctiphanes norvegica]|uniref:Secreted protein n=1 Tax=Meganyctiphanes norvegica TaxID=48144 RepID=A0AAV2SKL4_MEGNR